MGDDGGEQMEDRWGQMGNRWVNYLRDTAVSVQLRGSGSMAVVALWSVVCGGTVEWWRIFYARVSSMDWLRTSVEYLKK